MSANTKGVASQLRVSLSLKSCLFFLSTFVLLISVAFTRPSQVSATGFACDSVKADLWFGNDESGSVSAGEFLDSLDFMYQISDSFDYDATTGVQAGAFAWDDTDPPTNVIMPITENFSDTDDSGLNSTTVVTDTDSVGVRDLYTGKVTGGGGTDLTIATQYMAELINAGNGRRTGVPQIAIILTDASSGQLTGDAAGWIAAADDLRVAGEGEVGIVLVLIAEAATAYAGAAGPTVDSVAGTDGLIITVPTYADAANPAQGYIDDVTGAICDTIESIAPSDDNDNVTIGEEDGGPNSGDGNNDGTIDSDQPDVTTAINSAIGKYTTTAVSGGCTQVTAVNFYKESSMSVQDPDHEYPLGLHGFNVDCTGVGATVNVTYYWDKVYDTSKWTYRKFNAAQNKYLDFNSRVTYGTATLGAQTVTTVSYSVTDGGEFDGDGIANGRILDPVGPTTAVLAATGSRSTYFFLTGLALIFGCAVAARAKTYIRFKLQ